MTRFSTLYPKGTIPIFKHKKNEHVREILDVLADYGPSNTFDIARMILLYDPEYKDYIKIPYFDIKKRAGIYNKLILGRKEKPKGKFRITKEYLGLISEGYVVKTKIITNEKRNKIPTFYLTLKGCFTVLGFYNLDIKKFLEHASRNHLYFKYIHIILEATSLSFVKQIFTNPIRDYIEKGRINLSLEDIGFYFTIIAEASYNVFFPKTKRLLLQFYWNNPKGLKPDQFPGIKEIEKVMDNNYYYERLEEDWEDSVIEKFYKSKSEENFYRNYCDDYSELEANLLYRIMTQLHSAYFLADPYIQKIKPRTPRFKLRRSKALKKHLAYKKRGGSWKP